MKNAKTSIDRAVEQMVALDAAGWGVVVLRADREADIRRVVARYPHLYRPRMRAKDSPPFKYDNIKESIGGGRIKDFISAGGFASAIGQGENEVADWLAAGLVSKAVKMQHRLLYVPNAKDLLGDSEDAARERSPAQLQTLYLIRALCEEKKRGLCHSLIVIGCTDEKACRELAEYAYVVDVGCPDREEIDEIIWQACADCGGPRHGLEAGSANELAEILRGMRQDDIRAVISLAYAQHEYPLMDGARDLFDAALEAKMQRIAGVRGLRWIKNDKMPEVGGLQTMRDWLTTRRAAFNYTYAARKCGVSSPKGALLAGLPGCGKTLFAKYASHLLSDGNANRIPVLQMDLSAMLGKYVGDSESRFARALRTVESVAPCVVIVDEIEKFFGGVADGNSDVSRHIFASLLDWMQAERDKSVLVLATANKVDRLPPELKRKGRFDETFFVGIPTRKECEDILRIHLRRKADMLADDFDFEKTISAVLRGAAERRRFFNGADIESIVNAAFCALFARLPLDKIEDIQKGSASAAGVRHTGKDVREALLEELDATRSYFDNNMDETAGYWVAMRRLNFRNAGGNDLFAGVGYHEETGRFDLACANGCDDSAYADRLEEASRNAARKGDYDESFRLALAQRIFLFVRREQSREGRS